MPGGLSSIDGLWQRLGATFGHRWVSSYGAEPSRAWLDGLMDLSAEELRTGLQACLSWDAAWPPTLPEFRALCRPRVVEAHQVFVRLPEPPERVAERRAVGLAAIADWRESVRLADWLRANAGRVESDFSMLLRSIRAVVRVF